MPVNPHGSSSGGPGSGGPGSGEQPLAASPQAAFFHRVGINPDAVGQLVAAMNTAVEAFATASQVIGRIGERANQAVLSTLPAGAGDSPKWEGAASSPPDGGKLQALIKQVPPVAKEVNKRLTHFRACERDTHIAPGTHGPLTIDPTLWFTDGPPPDPGKINKATSYLTSILNAPDDPDSFPAITATLKADSILSDWEQLSATDADALLNGLTPSELKQLNALLSNTQDKDVLEQFSNFILANAGPSTVARLRPFLTSLQLSGAVGADPYWKTLRDGPVSWVPVDEPLFGPDGPDPDTDVDQASVGDCYFMSALAAVAHTDPRFIESHIHQDANGNYTVTLYRNGQPVNVTVTPDLPEAGGVMLGAQTNSGDDWAAIYEKAWAQLNGGYGGIDAGVSSYDAGVTNSSVYTAITGRPATSQTWKPGGTAPSLSDIKSMLSSGHALSAGTPSGKGHFVDSRGEKIFKDHEYWIKKVYTDPATGQQMIQLVNPWGEDSGNEEYVNLTYAEFQKYFTELDGLPPAGNVPVREQAEITVW